MFACEEFQWEKGKSYIQYSKSHTTYHVQSFRCIIGRRFTISNHCQQRDQLFLRLAIRLRCRSEDLRCTSSFFFPSTRPRFSADHGRVSQDAIDIAKESFQELKDVDRERISFEVYVALKDKYRKRYRDKQAKAKSTRRTAEIGRTAWPFVVPSLARFEIVEIRVAPVRVRVSSVVPGETMMAVKSSQSQASSAVVGRPPPYAPEKGGCYNVIASYDKSQISSSPSPSPSPSPPSLITRIVNLLTPKSSRSRLFL